VNISPSPILVFILQWAWLCCQGSGDTTVAATHSALSTTCIHNQLWQWQKHTHWILKLNSVLPVGFFRCLFNLRFCCPVSCCSPQTLSCLKHCLHPPHIFLSISMRDLHWLFVVTCGSVLGTAWVLPKCAHFQVDWDLKLHGGVRVQFYKSDYFLHTPFSVSLTRHFQSTLTSSGSHYWSHLRPVDLRTDSVRGERVSSWRPGQRSTDFCNSSAVTSSAWSTSFSPYQPLQQTVTEALMKWS